MASSSSSATEGTSEITLTVKTLDGKNRSFTVQQNLTIKQFKEKISSSIEIPADTQRLIFQGRVMQDDKLLRDYDVDGKVIHLVQRAPPTTLSGASTTSTTSASNTAPPQQPRRSESHVIHLGRVQQQPTSREARARLRQAEFNLGIINDALHLLEQRTGVTLEDLPGPDEAESRREDDMDFTTTTTAPDTADGGSTATTTSQSTGGSSTATSAANQEQQQTTSGPSPAPGSNSQDNSLTATELADFLDRVLRTNNRMVPHLRRYRNYLRSEENNTQTSRERRNAQETVNRVNEALHAMSHMMHSLSDVMVNMGNRHPRQCVANAPSPFQLPGTASMSIPFHMNIRAARPNAGGNPSQPQTNQRQTGTATATSTAASTGPSVSEGSSTPGTTSAGTATTATVNSGETRTATFGPFTIPLGTIPSTNSANPAANSATGSANVIIEALPQISIHNIGVIHTEDDMYGSSGESNDSTGPVESSVTIEATSVPEGRPTAPPTSSSGNQQQSTTATTLSGHFGAVPGPATSTSSFTFGPTTSVNVLPNVPGMPPGVLQNIIGTMLQQQGRGNQPVQVNVIRQSAPQQIVMDLPLDDHMQQHQHIHMQELRAHHFPAGGRPGTQSSDASQQAAPATVDASTATQSNAATNTRGSSEVATNTASTRTSSATAGTNTERPAPANPWVGRERATYSGNSSVGTGTDPNLGMSSQSTNTPQVHIGINGRGGGIPIALQPPQLQGHHHPQQPSSQSQPRPAAPGGPVPGNSVYADPYLMCHSHNYDTQSARSAFRALQARMRARGMPMPQPSQQVPNLSTMVSGLVGNIFGQAGQAFNMTPRTGANTGTNTTTNAATSAARGNSANPTSTSAATSGNRTTNAASAATASSSNNSGVGPPPLPLNPFEMFASMFGGQGGRPQAGGQMPVDIGGVIGNLMQATRAAHTNPGGQNASSSSSSPSSPPGGTLADMFTYFRPQGEEHDENASVLVCLLETIAPHMGLADLFSLVMGNTRVVGQLRRPLRDFVSERLATVGGSVERLVTSALDDMMSEIQHIQSLVQVRPGVDFALSVRSCLNTHLTTIFTAINSNSPSDDDEFGRNLYALWMKMMAETIGLCIYCIQDGDAGFSNMVQEYMPRLNQGMNPAITIWMTTSLQDILISFHRNHPVSESQIMAYVVHKDSGSTSEPSSSVPSANLTSSNNTEPASVPAPMEVEAESLTSPQPPRAKAARTMPEEEDSTEIFLDAQETLTSRTPAKPTQTAQQGATPKDRPSTNTTRLPATAAGGVTPPAVGSRLPVNSGARNGSSDNWQSVIPQEWIPVINQDLARQRDQRPQPPLSDAYLQGLPAKRRRMMTVEHVGEMGSMSRYLPSALTRAARAARVEPISSDENLTREATDNRDLQAELEEEVTAVLQSRVTSDTDFSSERFPNAKEYFHKSKRH